MFRSITTAILGFAAAALTLRPQPQISGDVREFLASIHMEDMPIDELGNTVRVAVFSGVNLQIVNGLGATETTNGAGNLIVGYSEPNWFIERTGSHNIVGGRFNNHVSFGGLVLGESNTIVAPCSSILGGRDNATWGSGSSISAGHSNFTVGTEAWIGGGLSNAANAAQSSIVGGAGNFASQQASGSSVCGGNSNQVDGEGAVVSGGSHRVAAGPYDWAAGSLWEDQ